MGTSRGPGFGERLEERLEDLVERIEAEARRAAAYVNDSVVPVVRKESITAMRSAADALRNLADKIEKAKGPEN